jgi:hypothetical protein
MDNDLLTYPTLLMSRSRTNPCHKKAPLRLKHLLSGFRHGWRSQSGDEEAQPLVAGGPSVPPSLHRPSLSHELEDSPLPDVDVVGPPHKRYALIAQVLLPSLLPRCPLLNPDDINLAGEHPFSGGGFAQIWEATYNGRKVVLKSYRCYVSFDITRVVTVPRDHF